MIRIALSALLLLGLVACETQPPSLYDRLGGKAGISAVVDQFVANIAADPSIAPRFAKTDIPKLKANLVDQICQTAGGPCTYTGKDMKTAHKGMHITVAEFNATGTALAKALDKFNVPEREKNELLNAIGGMQKDIVGQ